MGVLAGLGVGDELEGHVGERGAAALGADGDGVAAVEVAVDHLLALEGEGGDIGAGVPRAEAGRGGAARLPQHHGVAAVGVAAHAAGGEGKAAGFDVDLTLRGLL